MKRALVFFVLAMTVAKTFEKTNSVYPLSTQLEKVVT